jgi:ribonuclease G
VNIELVINKTKSGLRIAMLEDGHLVELHEDKGNQDYAVGDIYLGRVKKVLPSLNAGFVDIGHPKDAFLHYLDLGPQYRSFKKYAQRSVKGTQQSGDLTNFKLEGDIDKKGNMKDVVSASQNVLVQVAKEAISTKGPRLTAEVTLAGRYLVLVPFSSKISISQRIQKESERKRLRVLLQSIRPENCGIIVRTVAQEKGAADLHSDLEELSQRWKELHSNLRNAKPRQRVLGEINKTSSLLRDLLTPDFSQILVNDPDVANEVREFLAGIAPDKVDIVKESKAKDVFDDRGVHRMIKASFGRQVNLRSGAYLIVEHTEAMHVIDVNSGGRKAGATSQEENATATNLECATEIARLLRLRDMGGIICVDFIDMGETANRRQLTEALRKSMKPDKAKHNVLAPSRFGVVEITRQRVRPVTDIKTAEECPSCNGTGKVTASILVTDGIEAALQAAADRGLGESTLILHPMVEAYITKGFWNNQLKSWKKSFGMKIHVEANSSMELLEHHLYDGNGEEIAL